MFFFYFKVCAYPKYKLPPRADETIVFCMQNTRLYSLKKIARPAGRAICMLRFGSSDWQSPGCNACVSD